MFFIQKNIYIFLILVLQLKLIILKISETQMNCNNIRDVSMAREGATEINILCQVNKTHLWPKRKKTKQNKNSSSCGNWLDSLYITWGCIYIYIYITWGYI